MRKILDLFGQDLSVINLGLELFGESLAEQGAEVTQVDWRPPAGGSKELIDLLDRLEDRAMEQSTSMRQKRDEQLRNTAHGH